jgi:hypothetical protein
VPAFRAIAKLGDLTMEELELWAETERRVKEFAMNLLAE